MGSSIPQQLANEQRIAIMTTEIANLPKELWEHIPDFPGYQLSNYGRVKSIARYIYKVNGQVVFKDEKILKPKISRVAKSSKSWFVQMSLRKDNKDYSLSVIRFVYYLFVAPFDINDRSITVIRKDKNVLNCHHKNLQLEIPVKAIKNNSDVKGFKNSIRSQVNLFNPGIEILNTDLIDLPGERWMYIPGFNNRYQLSDYGRVKSVARTILCKNGRISDIRERLHRLVIIPDTRESTKFHIYASLIKDGICSTIAVARLVYNLFVASFDMNDYNYIIIKKDNNPLNCYYTNLQLQTVSETITEMYAVRGKDIYGHRIKPVNQYDKNGTFLRRYDSTVDAAKETGVLATTIKGAVNQKRLQAKKFYWQFGEPHANIDISGFRRQKYLSSIQKPVQKLALDGEVLETYPSISFATKVMGFKSICTIHRACKNINYTGSGYRWQYVDFPQQILNENTKSSVEVKKIKKRILKPVNQYSLDGTFISKYKSVKEASIKLGITSNSIRKGTSTACRTVNKFYWRYGKAHAKIDVSEFEINRTNHFNKVPKPVQKLTLQGKPLETYSSISAAANAMEVRPTGIVDSCKSSYRLCKGYRWRFIDEMNVLQRLSLPKFV